MSSISKVITSLAASLNRLAPRKALERFGPWAIIALAAVLRLWNLGYPNELVFDETYYVKDAWTLWNTGSEKAWPVDPNPAFEAGAVDSYLTTPSFVVHPPLGKWLIGFGMWLFGPTNSFAWRITVAVLGIAAVALIMMAARLLFKSKSWALVAGFLFAIDGHAIVLSRTALLDNVLMFFALLAFYFVLRDQRQRRIDLISWNRPWLLWAALAIGAATAVKWSGLYFLATLGLYIVISETLARKSAGQKSWLTDGIFKQGSITFVLLVPISLAVYLLSWLGWILTPGGYDRASGDNWFSSLINYHQAAYGFHVGLHTPHSYASNPITWLWAIRPTSFFYEGLDAGEAGCDFPSGCSSAITALGNPLIWWSAAIAVFFTVLWYFRTRERTAGLILLGMVAGYVPWLFFMNRTVFQFYSVVFLPWSILALVFTARTLINRSARPERAQGWFMAFLLACAAISAFFLPIWIGTWVPYWFWQLHMWLPSWI